MSGKSQFKFANYSGTYQLRIQNAEDLLAIPSLDEQFWMATSAPTHQFHCDQKLIEFLDEDGDGRILSRDVRRALAWIKERLSDMDGLAEASPVLRIKHVNPETDAGKRVLVTARRVLQNFGKPDCDSISLDEIRKRQTHYGAGFFGGKGIIPLQALTDDDMREFGNHIAIAVGSTPAPNGQPGVDREKLESFLKAARELLVWRKKADESGEQLFPLGDGTASGYELIDGLRMHIDRYFRLCRLIVQNQIMDRQTPKTSCPADIMEDSGLIDAFLEADPPARPNAENILDLRGAINPAFQEKLLALEKMILIPVLGSDWKPGLLNEHEWTKIKTTFTAYEVWLREKSGGEAEKIGPEKLKNYLNSDLSKKLQKLIELDIEIGKELSAAKDLEYLIVLQAHFMEFCNNFVSFHNLYDPEKRAMFESGRLIISGRVFNLNLNIRDPEAHSRMAAHSGMFLIYSEVTGSKPEEKFFIATPVTALTTNRLGAERRGVFFDRAGKEWDARVIKVVDNAVSVRQAVAKPFVHFGQVIANSFDKVVSGAEKQIESGLSNGVGQMEAGLKGGVAPRENGASAKSGGAREWMLTGSIAIAALGTSFAFIAKTISGLNWTNVLYTFLGGLGILLIPLILIADYKLSKRNLAGLLEASGWAINADMKLSRNLAKILSPRPRHPAGFGRLSRDLTREFHRKLKIALK